MRRNENGRGSAATYGTKRKRDFHRQVRVVYRACRRLYGKERTQDECLRVFKVVFPVLYRARESKNTNFRFQIEDLERLETIVGSWMVQPCSELDKLCAYVLNEADVWKWKEDFLQFCEDIMPVVMRIRKLTPRECFRLMDVDDKDIEKIQASGISNSAQYKLAGNSICVSPMFHIFRKLFIETEADAVKGNPTQLSLF